LLEAPIAKGEIPLSTETKQEAAKTITNSKETKLEVFRL